jgi:serine phosphatase RsbU (regulator of sigma subunit)/CHASE2 domain-containing sensor protein
MINLERHIFFKSLLAASAATLMVLAADGVGLLAPFENWLSDMRSAHCQLFSPPPSSKIAFLDIDDGAIETLGRWPWPRRTQARLLQELARAHPKIVGLDVVFSESADAPAAITAVTAATQPSTQPAAPPSDDAFLAAALRELNVVTAVDFDPPHIYTPEETAVRTMMLANLQLSQDKVSDRLKSQHLAGSMDEAELQDVYIAQRRAAMGDRLREKMSAGITDRSKLVSMLLPGIDLSLSAPILRLLDTTMPRVASELALRRYATSDATVLGGVRPLDASLNLAPIPELNAAMPFGGFITYEFFHEPVVRYVPLFVEYDGGIYPQMGLVIGSLMAGADLNHATISPDSVDLPSARGPIRIPVRNYRSIRLKQDVPLVADIPWFGKSDWRTMFDAPRFTGYAGHKSMGALWDICLTKDKIVKNNTRIDLAAQVLLSDRALGIDESLANTLAARNLADDDATTRAGIAAQVLDVLEKSQFEESYAEIPDAKKTDEEHRRSEMLQNAKRVLTQAPRQNDQLTKQLADQRADLAKLVRDKCVLIGYIATGDVDVVTTPLHSRCPGVVVHAAIANAVLTNAWYRTAPDWLTVLLILLAGLLTALAVAHLAPPTALLAAAGLVAGYLAVNGFVLFDYSRYRVGIAGPVIAIIAAWGACTLVRLLIEGRERKRIGREMALADHEMQLARKIQQALIPTDSPTIFGIDCCGWTLAASVTGGDCFDVWHLPDGRLGVLVADASGHGLGPSMIVSQVRTLVRVLSEAESSPLKLLARVNKRLTVDLQSERFVTAFLGFLSTDGKLAWASAGHGPVLWRPNTSAEIAELETTCLPLGVMEEMLSEEEGVSDLQPGGTLYIVSDGIFESPDPKGEQYGVPRLLELLNAATNEPAAEIVRRLQQAMLHWQGKEEPVDDQTVVIIRRIATPVPMTDQPAATAPPAQATPATI